MGQHGFKLILRVNNDIGILTLCHTHMFMIYPFYPVDQFWSIVFVMTLTCIDPQKCWSHISGELVWVILQEPDNFALKKPKDSDDSHVFIMWQAMGKPQIKIKGW